MHVWVCVCVCKVEKWDGRGGTWPLEIIYLWVSHFIRPKLKCSALEYVYQVSQCYHSQLQQAIEVWLVHTDHCLHFFLDLENVEFATSNLSLGIHVNKKIIKWRSSLLVVCVHLILNQLTLKYRLSTASKDYINGVRWPDCHTKNYSIYKICQIPLCKEN